MNFATKPTWYCGIHDYWLELMSPLFRTNLVNRSYKDFPPPSLTTNQAWDDYCGMHLMGGEL